MFMGPDSALFTTGITMGRRVDAAIYKISHISARPCEDVAVIVLAPAAAAPTHALIALCSDSTGIISVFTLPSATYWQNPITISVCGVIGYAATTSGSICFIAYAAA